MGKSGWELYNLKDDIGESQNLAKKNPDKLNELIKEWQKINSEMVAPAW